MELVSFSELGGFISKAKFPDFCNSLGLFHSSDEEKTIYSYIETLFFLEEQEKIEVGIVQEFMLGLIVPSN
jgi:hypothetical protein